MLHLPASIQSSLQRTFGLPTLCMREFTELGVTRPAFLLRHFTAHILSQFLPQPLASSSEKASDGEDGKVGDSKRFLLDGPSGIGKSVSLLQIASVLVQAGKPVLYVPDATKWTDGYYAYYPAVLADGQEAIYEQPELASEILSSLSTAGLPSRSNFSSIDTLEALLHTRTHTLIVDQVNALYRPTLYRDKDGSPVPVQRMRVLQLFKEAIQSHPNVVAATSYSSPRLRRSQHSRAFFDGSKVDVPLLTNAETTSLLDYYARHLGILHPPHNVHSPEGEQYVQRKRFLSGNVPLELWRICQLEHIYHPRVAAVL